MTEPSELTVPGTVSGLPFGPAGAVRSLAERLETTLVGLVGLLIASVVAAAQGGFFPDSWAWVALLSLFVATLRLILTPSMPLRRLDWAFVAGLGAFAVWVALSSLWAQASTPSIDETIRDVSYTAAVLMLLLIVTRRTVEALLFGALLGVAAIATYSLLTRLHPDWVGNWDPAQLFRLSGPIGYWNGLGVYAAMGVLLALGLVVGSDSRTVQAVAGATPVLLMPTILFTFSRGAWLALAVGLVAAILFDPRRLRLIASALTLAPWPAVAIALAWKSDHLTKSTITLQQAADEGGSLLVWILLLAVVAAVAALAFRAGDARVHVPARVRRGLGGMILAGVVAAAVAVFAVYGTPWALAHRAADSFASVPKVTGSDQTGRLFDLSSDNRVELWRVSLDQFHQHPAVGDGAGSFAAAWNLHRSYEATVHDSHSLYLEALGELGIVGLALLVLALAVPLAAAVRARRRPLVTGAFATYAAFLAHAAVDWDWELAGVTLVALIAGVAVIILARTDEVETDPRSVMRVGVPAVTGVLSLLALAAVLSTVPLGRARAAYNRLDFPAATVQAQKAVNWAPWSSEALDMLGRAQLAQGQLGMAHLSFQRAVEKSPNDWELWRDLAAASPPPEARVAVRRALELNPLDTELNQLRVALEKQ